jgi:hypothetical protein
VPRRDVRQRFIDEIVTALLAYVRSPSMFRDGMAIVLANARRSNPRRDRKTGHSSVA